MPLQITTLNRLHLEAAAGLVCERYRDLRRKEPLLPERYERPEEFLPRLKDLAGDSPGVAAIRNGQLAGFMVGYMIPDFMGVRAAYSPEWANAAEPQDVRRIFEEMYARLSGIWIKKGCFTHAFTLFSNDLEGLEALQWLAFGYAGVDGIREVTGLGNKQENFDIRRAEMHDSTIVSELISRLERHMASPPVFWPHKLGDSQEWLADPQNAMFLAAKDGEILGGMGIGPANQQACTIIRDEGTASIISAYTLEASRGSGVATALLESALGWAREQGYTRCTVDFEAMNVQARRFWRQWFRTVCCSLVRCINPQMLKAGNSNFTHSG